MATLGVNDLKGWATPTDWDEAYLAKIQLASGESYEQFISDVARGLAMQNASIASDPLLASMVSFTTDVELEYPTGVSNGFEAATEYGRPDSKRATTTGHMLPLVEYDRALGWTWQSLKKARRAQLDADIASAMADVRNLYSQKVLTRLFKSTYDAVASGQSNPVADAGTADSTYVPPNHPDRASAFTSSHTHLGRLNGITQANLNTAIAHLWEHGHDAPYDLIVAQADIGSWTDATSVTGYLPRRHDLVDYGASETLARVDPSFYGIITTDYGPVRLRANARIPTAYWAVFKSYGGADQRNPLRVRYNPAFGVGAVLLAGDHIRRYPLEEAIMWAELGVGIFDRVGAYIVENDSSGTYATPTIS